MFDTSGDWVASGHGGAWGIPPESRRRRASSAPRSSGTTSSSTAPPRRWSSASCSSRPRPARRQLLAFATYAVGFVARPLGGVIFGHFGDRIGRRACSWSRSCSWASRPARSASCPPTTTIGVAAPILLVPLRLRPGPRPRRRVGRRGAAGRPSTATRAGAGSTRAGRRPACRPAPARPPACSRVLGRHADRGGVPGLGLADAVPAQRRARRRRPVHPPAHRGVAAVPAGGRQTASAPARRWSRCSALPAGAARSPSARGSGPTWPSTSSRSSSSPTSPSSSGLSQEHGAQRGADRLGGPALR